LLLFIRTNSLSFRYRFVGGKILSLAIAESSHSFISGSSNGTIHVVRIDAVSKKPNYDYTGSSLVRKVDKTEGAVVCVKHVENFETAQSLIIYATDGGIIHAWDMRSQREAWTMHNHPHLGLITSMVVDPSRHWLAVATNRGYVTCWDIRFKVCFKEWRLPDNSLIHQLSIPFWSQVEPTPSLLIAGGPGDLAEWDLDSVTCKKVFKTSAAYATSQTSQTWKLFLPTFISSSQQPTDVLAGSVDVCRKLYCSDILDCSWLFICWFGSELWTISWDSPTSNGRLAPQVKLLHFVCLYRCLILHIWTTNSWLLQEWTRNFATGTWPSPKIPS